MRASANLQQLRNRDQEKNHITCHSTETLIGAVQNLVIMLQSCTLYCPFNPSDNPSFGAWDLWNEPYPTCGVASACMSENAAVAGAAAAAAIASAVECVSSIGAVTDGIGDQAKVHHQAPPISQSNESDEEDLRDHVGNNRL